MNKTTIPGIQPIEVSERRPLIPDTKPVIILYQQQEGFGMELEVEQDQIGPLRTALREDTANARLIAVAPDLLAIVAELARHDGMSGDLPMLILKARSVLAKATTTTHKE
jgi:hypothetical protein